MAAVEERTDMVVKEVTVVSPGDFGGGGAGAGLPPQRRPRSFLRKLLTLVVCVAVLAVAAVAGVLAFACVAVGAIVALVVWAIRSALGAGGRSSGSGDAGAAESGARAPGGVPGEAMRDNVRVVRVVRASPAE